MMIINAENLVAGRIGTIAAKKALEGEKVDIVNAEKAIITGNRLTTFAIYKRKIDRGIPLKGPYYPKRPDMLLRRIIRGMLTHRKDRGRKAFARIMCYIGVPDQFKDKKMETIEGANVSKLSNLKYVTLDSISKHLGLKQ